MLVKEEIYNKVIYEMKLSKNDFNINDMRYIILNTCSILWCDKIEPEKEMIFTKIETFRDLSQALLLKLKKLYPKETEDLDDIAFSKDPMVLYDKNNSIILQGKPLKGLIYEELKDNDTIYLLWLRRNSIWKASLSGIK